MTQKAQHHELHPLCTFFPRLEGAEFEALKADIQANGLRQPIVLHQGLILDGGNRYRACVEAGVEPSFVEFAGQGSLAAFVLSANLHRRHMTPGQRAAIVASARDWERTQLAGRPKKAPPKPAPGSTLPADTVKLRAQQADASVATQRRADAVAKAAPELAREVAQGKTTLGQAVRQVAPQLAQRPAEPAPAAPRAAPPKADPADAAAARIAKLEAEIADLRGELNEARDAAADLAEQLESYDKATAGEVAAAKEMTRLKQQVRVAESQRDQHMTTCNELRRQVKMLQRQLAKMERAA